LKTCVKTKAVIKLP